jgi:hypothetical protein
VAAMGKIFALIGFAAMVWLPVRFTMNLTYDLAHPELWTDCRHDPRLYGALAMVIPLILLLAARKRRKQRAAEFASFMKALRK